MTRAVLITFAGLVVGSVEFARPGWIVPGVCGATLFCYGFSRMAQGPLDARGLLGLAAALLLLLLEARLRTRVLGAGAGFVLAWGLRNLYREPDRISWPLALSLALPLMIASGWLLGIAWQAREAKMRP